MEHKDFEKEPKNSTQQNANQGSAMENEVVDQENQDEQVHSEEGNEREEQHAEDQEVKKLQSDLNESKDKYLRLYSEFENFRRRTAKERLELIKNANEDLIVVILPVIDDFDRAQKAFEDKKDKADNKANIEGFHLIQHKLNKILEQKGLKPMNDLIGKDFDSEVHEAITKIPAPEEKLKGKVVDVVEKGYYLNDKVIRFAKVVIGA
ncbi:nucleotide exchange factor GrpE [soil metagenome]